MVRSERRLRRRSVWGKVRKGGLRPPSERSSGEPVEALTFAYPWAVWLAPLLALLIALVVRGVRRRRALLEAFGDPALLRRFSHLEPGWLGPLRAWSLSLALLAIAAALARPVLVTRAGEAGSRPPGIGVVLDVSRSMAAEDYGPGVSRLAKAKEMLLEALPDLAGASVGAVTFARLPYRQVPLTDDHLALRYILAHWVQIESAPGGGSDIAQGIQEAVGLFEGRRGEHVLLLFSDGGDGEPERQTLRSALAEARSGGVRVLAFGLGGPEPSRVPTYDRGGRFAGWLTMGGEVATTRLDEGVMREVAAGTDGAYTRVVSGRELGRALAGSGLLGPRSSTETLELYQWPLGAALLLLALERLAGALTRHWPRPRARREAKGRGRPSGAGFAATDAGEGVASYRLQS